MTFTPDEKPGRSNSKKRKIPWLRWAGSLLGLGLLFNWLINEGWSTLIQSLGEITWEYFLIVLILTIASRLATIARWHILLRSANVPISLKQSARLVFAGLFAANFLPTTVGGDLVRFLGTTRLKLDAATCAASLVMDRLVGMAGMATVLPIGLVQFLRTPLPEELTSLPSLIIPLPEWMDWIKEKLEQGWNSFIHAWQLWISHPADLFKAYLFTWGHMLSLFISIWFLFGQVGEKIPFWQIAGLWSMAYFITLLPISINGLGVQEVVITFFFVNYAGVATQHALVIALIMRFLPILVSLPGAFFVGALLEPKEEKIGEVEQ